MYFKNTIKKKRSASIYIKLIALGVSGESGNDQDGVKEDLNFICKVLILLKGNAHVEPICLKINFK